MVAPGGKIDIQPDVAARAAERFAAAAERLAGVAATLEGALGAAGECWGDDESGQEFAKDYVPGADGTAQGFAAVVEGLRNVHRGLADTARSYRDTEGTNTAGFGGGG
ncbi:WXG100 family type VII secretion target [Actinokineospora spheciospongiae]|uniref:WXG100 family type VII secretion target n=1 Tax=Actinokineospora spheciospongiae TaxID=909613 RepID=UPI000D70D2B6|nr:WXG100 family type VII secretion target [Actinokineospora spheciospongiae]PWW63481.1 type VII secretion system (Wss) protein ESAT-6 [Actinokineospora spheciospongiae]